jgi:4a-hydroxytetrahydrobiopterin dehydratase
LKSTPDLPSFLAVPALLDDNAIASALIGVSSWTREGREIIRTFTFDGFAAALTFVNRVAAAAELAGHHPDILLRWNKVTLRLTTHSRGGLTALDFTLAETIDRIPDSSPHS